MKRIKISICALSFCTLAACSDFLDINSNPNAPTDVSADLLLAPIEEALAGEPGFQNVNHLMQTIALNQLPPNLGTYQFTNASFDDTWLSYYVTCMNNARLMHDKALEDGNMHYAGIARILMAYSLGPLTDLFGDVPYSEAFQGVENQFPAYDSQESIYQSIQGLLDEGIAYIDQNQGVPPGSDDFFYGGDMGKWRRAAFTLKARYYMRLSEVGDANAQAQLVLSALENGMQSNEDDMRFVYPGSAGYYNRWYNAMLPVETVILGSTLVDSLVAREDPRIAQLVAPAATDGAYRGRRIGISFDNLPSLNSFSVVGPFYGSTNSATYLVNYTESLFLKAEATLILSGVSAAEPIYKDGISAHMAKLGVDGTAYIARRGQLTAANALEYIMTEKQLASYLSIENYSDWRRTGYPRLQIVANPSVSGIPRRFLYPQTELANNPQPQHSATLTDRVWWDVE